MHDDRDPATIVSMGRPWAVSFRVSLIVVMPAIALATGAAIAVVGFTSTHRAVDSLAGDLFREVSQAAVRRVRSDLLGAVPALEAARLLHDDDSDVLARRFAALLGAHPDFAWISYSDGDGSFTGAQRTAEGSIRVNQSRIRDGKTAMAEHDVLPDASWRLRRREEDTKYDPRARPFYVSAETARRRVWTPPYVFFDSGVPGITCAMPRFDAAGEVAGVFTVDFDLNGLSKAMAEMSPGAHGRAFLLSDDGAVIAHPRVRVVERSGTGNAGRLVTTKDVADPALRTWASAAAGRVGADGPFRFTAGREEMIGAAIALPADTGLAWTVGVVAPASDFDGEVVRARRTAIGLAGAAIVLAVLVASFLATRIARPLERIAGEMAEAGQMRLEARASRPSRFLEIERMDEALGRLRSGLRSFSRFVPTDLVRRVLSSGHEAVLFADSRRCTVFFSDVAGFTRLAERIPAAELVRILGAYLDETTRVIDIERGTIDKFIGDAIMAFWGAPEDAPDQAARACVAALRVQARLAYLRGQDLSWAKLLPTRIGIATGDVVVGNIGATTRLNYTALGDTVNVASRLEGLNKRYETRILVSETTYEEARHAVVARAIDLVSLAGREGALRVYEPLALASEASPTARELARLFDEGLALYLRRDFGGAAARYARAADLAPGDAPSAILLDRARRHVAAPPPPDWNGISSMTEK